MNLHKEYTTEIFQLLSKGNFISSNASKDHTGKLYRYISEEDHFELLKTYFALINFNLESGNGYYYFSQISEKDTLREEKILKFERYIDILDLFTSLENPPFVGTRYTITEIAQECLGNPMQKEKLEEIRIGGNKANITDKLREILDFLTADTFLELEDEETETYKVLDSFNYLLEIIKQIEIYGEQALSATE